MEPLEKSEIRVSVVVPIRNESKYIEKCIESIFNQDYPKNLLEIIFVDGNSEDKTVDIIKKYITEGCNIRLLNNPNKFIPYALNIGIKSAVGKYIVRMDAHSQYANDYISKCIEYLEKTDAINVGGPVITAGKTVLQKVIAAAYHSDFALGGGKNHDKDYEGYADTVFLGTFKKQDIIDIGMYDERFIRNEDDDLTFRMIERGFKIYSTPAIKSIYYPRSTYSSLFKQYFEYGMWKVAIIKKHGRPARFSHLVPMAFVTFLAIFGIASFFFEKIFWMFIFVMGIYILLNLYFSFKNDKVTTIPDKLRLMLVHFILHISYGLGFWVGIFKFWNFK